MNINDKKIGIVGGGQLGKMMILEAKRLGFYVAVLDPSPDCPAHSICDLHIVGDLNDPQGYKELSKRADVITYEWENISVKVLEKLEKDGYPVYHPIKTLKKIQNKYSQNEVLQKNNIPVPNFKKVKNIDEIKEAGKPENFGYPLMLKTTTGGYDGKGTALIKTKSDVEDAFRQLGSGAVELMVEEFVDFEKEISLIACRNTKGDKVMYPIAENTHVNSILDTTIAPAGINKSVSDKVYIIGDKLMGALEFVGTFCIEMFVTKTGDVLVNEIAPRPHNSGHYTIEACFANQFENHIRAITGLPLGYTSLKTPAVMINLIGQSNGVAKLEGLEEAYNHPNVHIHLYGKRESKKDRKMGHYTVVDEDISKAKDLAYKLKNVISVEATTLGHP